MTSNGDQRPLDPRLVALLLFGSGACALVYQVAWQRDLRLVFGASTAATAAVLAIFMGGLGVGGALIGFRADRQLVPLRLYAHLELAIAASSAVTPLLVLLARKVYVALGGSEVLGLGGATVVRLLLSLLVLGLPTLLMGGTLPAAARAVESGADAGRRRLALLYGANTLGAVTGAFIANFLLLEVYGVRSSLWLACLVNALVGITARSLSRTRRSPAQLEEPAVQVPAVQSARAPASFVLLAAGVTGFAFFVMEMVWYRMLGPLLGGSTYTFGLILVVALLGIGLGGAAYAFGQGSVRPSLTAFALTCGLEALCIAVAYALGDRLAVAAALLQGLSAMGFAGKVVGWTLVTAVVILPAAAVSGFQFPLLVGLLGRGHQEVGRHTGLAYAWNTAGAIVGSLAGGFVLLPALTAPGCWRLVVVVLALLGASAAVLAALRDRARLGVLAPAAAITGALLLLLSLGPTAAWRHSPIGAGRVTLDTESRNKVRGWLNDQRRAVVWEIDGVESSVAMSDVSSLAFILNGKVDGNARFDAPTQVMLGMVSATLHPNPKTAMVIGLGTGESAGWLAAVDSIERVDVVELEPGIVEVARRCAAANHDALANPKLNLIAGDGREVLLTTPSRYDLIASAPSNPYRAGIASLYTVEFYRAVAARLAPGGIFSQWMQAYEVDTQTLSMIYATLASVFGSVETWQTNTNDMLFICRMEERPYPVPELRARLAREPFRSAALAVWGATDLEGFLSRYVARPSLASAVAGTSEGVNTDDRMQVEYGFARTVGKRRGFSLVDVRLAARRRDEQRPLLVGGAVDWLRVEDNYFLMHFADRLPVPEAAAVAPDERLRIRAANRYLSGNLAGVVEAWGQQGRPPEYPEELAMLGEALADAGNEAALAQVQALRRFRPVDADLILARFHLRRGDRQAALAAMAAAFERLRNDPWADQLVAERGLALAVELASSDREMAVALDRLLAPPFAVKMLNAQRQNVRLEIATRIGCGAMVPVLHELEPWVPWNRSLLSRRLTCYDAARDPLTAVAARDFDAFLSQEPETFEEAVEKAAPGGARPGQAGSNRTAPGEADTSG